MARMRILSSLIPVNTLATIVPPPQRPSGANHPPASTTATPAASTSAPTTPCALYPSPRAANRVALNCDQKRVGIAGRRIRPCGGRRRMGWWFVMRVGCIISFMGNIGELGRRDRPCRHQTNQAKHSTSRWSTSLFRLRPHHLLLQMRPKALQNTLSTLNSITNSIPAVLSVLPLTLQLRPSLRMLLDCQWWRFSPLILGNWRI